MELVEGSTLRDYLNQQGALTVEQMFQLINPVLSALSAAHRIGIVHRDIKPENILISNDGRIKIADFGLARGTNLGQTMTAEASVILGSVSYLSPEQVQRGISDARSDIYSIGVMAFEMLTGKRPHISDSPMQIAFLHVNEDIPKVSSKGIKLPKELDELIYAATSRNPDDRPKDAIAFSNALRNIQIKFDPAKQQMSLELDLPIRKEVPKPSKKAVAPVIEEEPTTEITKPLKVKREKEKKPRKKFGKVAVILAIALGFGGWWTLIGPGARVTVPSVVGGTMTDADRLLKPIGLTSDVAKQEFSEDVAKGVIISTDPAGGEKVKEASVVHITLSKGPERYTIPSVAQLTSEAATKLLSSIPVATPVVEEIFNEKIPKGYVIGTEPASGTQVKRGTGIRLIVSKGIEQIALVNFSNKSGEEAINTLTEAGFKVSPKYTYSETVPLGAVVSQNPSQAKDYPKGTAVSLTISKGSAYVYIPNVYSLSETKAKSTLTSLDLQVIIKRMGTKAVKQVTSISPKVGSKVLRGSKVTITVG
jgi:serine/threonine-protein kinase